MSQWSCESYTSWLHQGYIHTNLRGCDKANNASNVGDVNAMEMGLEVKGELKLC